LLRSLAAAVLAGVLTWFLPQVLLFPAWGSAILAMTIAFAAAAVVVFRDVKTIVTI
jgi:hypothetical protein